MKKNKKSAIEFGYGMAKLTVKEQPPAPPPPFGFTSPFKTIHEWLTYLCDNNQPEKPIEEYHFSLIERLYNNLLCLEGYNKYKIEEDVFERRIDFKPVTHLFFALPNDEFGNLPQQQLQQKVLDEVMEFFKSAKFQNSFLSKGGPIRMGLAGEIWSR